MNDKKKTVLVVDDVPDDIVILEEILKGEYQVKAVTNGEAALKIARGDSPPDLILLDIMMPDMDGFEVCRNLKQDSAGATIPVIFLTAKQMSKDEKIGFELGAVDYIKKPVDPEIVKMRIKSCLEQKDLALRISEVRYRRLFETAQDGIMIVDSQTGAIVDANPSLAAMMGLSLEAFLGKRVSDLGFMNTIMVQRRSLTEEQKRKYVRYRDLPLKTIDGREIYVEFNSGTYQVNGRELLQFNIREITDLIEAERQRDRYSSRLSHYVATSPTITYSFVIQQGVARWQWVSENVLGILGYSSEEALAPNWWFDNLHASDRKGVLGIVSDLALRQIASREYRFIKKDRSMIWLHDEMRLIPGKGEESEVVGTLTDISGKKKAEEEIHLKSAALEAAANAVIIADRDGVIRWANPAFEVLTGYSNAEAVGKKPRNLVWSGEQDGEFYRSLWNTILAGKVWSGQLVNRRKSGELYDEEMTITPFLDDNRCVSSFIAIKNDVTEKVLARERLESALREKSALLREIHHRVNNNMQVIISLINISAQDIGNAASRGKLDDIIRRMHAMAIIHEQFYQAEDMSRIDFAVYIMHLLERLKIEFPMSSVNAVATCVPGQVFLHLEQAIPAGLIVSELLTNALKFAFAEGHEIGTIRVDQRLMGNADLKIEVSDNGVGIPTDLDPNIAKSMGMMLIRILSEQLGGGMEYSRGGGTVATLRFRISPLATTAPRNREEAQS
jgi:PAS domain S-box-containing protein